ncbi:MAG: MBL fold metallo-hydrolase [Alphaproteobacteria bacterium]|nr:MAG: MBL fold metallo-hydrolase [Alphaproteobacteria bacterium]
MATDFFTLEALPARYGDCLLLHYGTAADPGLVLIDGGPSQVWKPFLEPRLKALQAKRGAAFHIDMLMVSHIDDDHVLGITDFTKAWRAAKTAGQQWPYPVRTAWFNSFERISNATNIGAVTASVTASAGATTLTDVDLDSPEITNPNKDEARAGLKVLASVNNGSILRKDLEALAIPINKGFDGKLVRPGKGPAVPFQLGPELSLRVASPLAKQLDKLQEMFAKQLKPEDALAAYTDGSVPNLSSIAAVATYKGKTVLLTGDARGDYLIEGLKGEGLLDAAGKLHVDILKMPHHGSDRNVDPSFFTTITADHYVASADGTFGNPDRPTLEMLIDQRGKAAQYVIHLTYPVADIDARRKGEWDKDRQSEIDKGKAPRRAWDPDKDDLGKLFAQKQSEGYAFQFAAPAAAGQSAKVELLGPIPF